MKNFDGPMGSYYLVEFSALMSRLEIYMRSSEVDSLPVLLSIHVALMIQDFVLHEAKRSAIWSPIELTSDGEDTYII